MAKKKETKPKTAKAKKADAANAAHRPTRKPAPEAAPAAASEGTTLVAPRERVPDPRLPPAGTVIEKRDRLGAARCKCSVEDGGGIRYAGKLYKSLSAAALAAARDLGIEGKSFNGYVWWGLSKPPRPAGDPLDALGRAWERYRERATSVVGAVTDENRDKVRAAIEKQEKEIGSIAASVA